MKTVSVALDERTWQAAEKAAESRHTTLPALVNGFVRDLAAQADPALEERRTKARHALADALARCGAVVGEKPTRARTYSGKRFS